MLPKEKSAALDAFRKKCARRGLKITPQRALIFKEIFRATDHPGADAVYRRARKKMPNISFDTVYRTLQSFAEMGLLTLVEGFGEEKRFEPHRQPHHHWRCVKCHTIRDFETRDRVEIPLPASVRGWGTVVEQRWIVMGVCTACGGRRGP